jgi:hypothetical protein
MSHVTVHWYISVQLLIQKKKLKKYARREKIRRTSILYTDPKGRPFSYSSIDCGLWYRMVLLQCSHSSIVQNN